MRVVVVSSRNQDTERAYEGLCSQGITKRYISANHPNEPALPEDQTQVDFRQCSLIWVVRRKEKENCSKGEISLPDKIR